MRIGACVHLAARGALHTKSLKIPLGWDCGWGHFISLGTFSFFCGNEKVKPDDGSCAYLVVLHCYYSVSISTVVPRYEIARHMC